MCVGVAGDGPLDIVFVGGSVSHLDVPREEPSYRRSLRTAGVDRAPDPIHTGECERAEGELTGIAVNVGARIAAAAVAGEVAVSSTVRDLVAGSGLTLVDRGVPAFKGAQQPWRLFAVAR